MNRHRNINFNQLAGGLLVAALSFGILGCGDAPDAVQEDAAAEPRVETTSWGPVEVSLTFTPGQVSVNRDLRLEIRMTAPSEMDLTLPDLSDRLEGFADNGQYERDPVVANGKATRVVHVRLTPVVSRRYRVAPFAIQYTDRSVSPPLEGWFPTPPVVLEAKPLPDVGDDDDVNVAFEPVWVRPTARTITLYAGLIVLVAAALFGLWKLLSRVREEVALRRMSPRERALRELQQLLGKDLIGKKQIKTFYVELTMVVRRYIERRHTVRAPEQTTEEFLTAVSQDQRFSRTSIDTLKAFLEAADMVKFAGYQPGDAAITQATDTARAYVTAEPDEPEGD